MAKNHGAIRQAMQDCLKALLSTPIPGRQEEMMAFRERQEKWLQDHWRPAVEKAGKL